jgi:GMP synthase-like glutamine amidotransferase
MRFLVFQHLDIEHPGLFRRLFRERGIAWDGIELDVGQKIPDLYAYDALVVFGGPMDVWEEDRHPWLVAEKAAIKTWIHGIRRPYLGVCLGHQLLAASLDGAVAKMATPEVGVVDVTLTEAGRSDPLMIGVPARSRVLQWHGTEVSRMPTGGVVLAKNEKCAIQALRVGKYAYGLQYHVEIETDTVGAWHTVPEYAAALTQLVGCDGGEQLDSSAQREMRRMNEIASTLCANFQRIVARARACPPRSPI